MDNNENMYNTQPNQTTDNQNSTQNYYQNGADQTQNNGQYTQGNTYQSYGMNNQQPVDVNGKPLKNNFAMKLVFSILEIISCNIITLIMGIIGCVFTTKANNSYKQNRFEEFKSQAKTATICLWVGFASFIIGIILMIVVVVIGGMAIDEALSPSGSYTSTNTEGTAVTVDGTYIAIPLEFSDLEDMGFEIDGYYYGTEVAAGSIDFVAVDNAYGEDVMWAWVENRHSYDADVTECTVIGIDVDYNCDNYQTFVSEDGITFYCSKNDVIDLMGDPDEEDVDYDGRELWRWYIGEYNNSWQVVEITFDSYDDIFDIDIDYR